MKRIVHTLFFLGSFLSVMPSAVFALDEAAVQKEKDDLIFYKERLERSFSNKRGFVDVGRGRSVFDQTPVYRFELNSLKRIVNDSEQPLERRVAAQRIIVECLDYKDATLEYAKEIVGVLGDVIQESSSSSDQRKEAWDALTTRFHEDVDGYLQAAAMREVGKVARSSGEYRHAAIAFLVDDISSCVVVERPLLGGAPIKTRGDVAIEDLKYVASQHLAEHVQRISASSDEAKKQGLVKLMARRARVDDALSFSREATRRNAIDYLVQLASGQSTEGSTFHAQRELARVASSRRVATPDREYVLVKGKAVLALCRDDVCNSALGGVATSQPGEHSSHSLREVACDILKAQVLRGVNPSSGAVRYLYDVLVKEKSSGRCTTLATGIMECFSSALRGKSEGNEAKQRVRSAILKNLSSMKAPSQEVIDLFGNVLASRETEETDRKQALAGLQQICILRNNEAASNAARIKITELVDQGVLAPQLEMLGDAAADGSPDQARELCFLSSVYTGAGDNQAKHHLLRGLRSSAKATRYILSQHDLLSSEDKALVNRIHDAHRSSFKPAIAYLVAFLIISLMKRGWLDNRVAQQKDICTQKEEEMQSAHQDATADQLKALLAADSAYQESKKAHENAEWWQTKARQGQYLTAFISAVLGFKTWHKRRVLAS